MSTQWAPYSGPVRHDGKRTCPNCSTYTGMEASWLDPAKMVTPVYCVERTNKSTGEKFWGCPNFPSCKYSYNPPRKQYANIYEGFSCDDLQQ